MESKSDSSSSSSSSSGDIANVFHGKGNSSAVLSSGGSRQKVDFEAEASPNGNQEGESRKENPLENDVVLRNVLRNCAGRDLLNFRLVSTQWNSICIPLLKESECRLKLVYNPKKKNYTNEKDSSKTLSQLNRILSTRDFPVLNFKFLSGDLDCSEAGEFFTSHGIKIKGLLLQLSNGQGNPPVDIPHTQIHTLKRILMKQTENMDKLTLFSIPKEWEEDSSPELFPEPRNTIQLPQLTTLIFSSSNFNTPKSYRLAQDIIQAAVNLQRIYNYKIQFLEPLATAFENKIHAVRKIRFNPQEENLDLYLKFGEGAPKLEGMEISQGILKNSELGLATRKKICKILQLIVVSSKDTLQEISGILPIPLLPTFKFPRMQHISKLIICTDDQAVKSMNYFKEFVLLFDFDYDVQPTLINPPLDLANNFPALTLISFHFQSSRNFEACLTCFESSSKTLQPLHSVKYVHFTYGKFYPVPFLEKITLLFPALENFSIVIYPNHFQQTMPIIWKGFPNLEKLNLNIYKNNHAEIITENLDAGICGFSPETCVQLKRNSRNVRFEDVGALRENPSICDATKLSELSIKFHIPSLESDPLITRPLLSAISGIFGFDLARKRNGTKILLKRLEEKQGQIALGEITPYVDGFLDV